MHPYEALRSGQTWEAFCDLLREAGREVLRPEAPADPFNRAEGYRYLSRLVRIALEMHVECADTDFPVFMIPSHETAKIGADNPDNLYLSARIDGRHDYRITGRRGTVGTLNFASKGGGYANRDGRMDGTGFLDGKHLRVDADGRIEIVLSQRPHTGNWLPISPESNQVLVRQTFRDRRTETPAQLTIERIGGPAHPAPLDPAAFHERLLRAGQFVGNTARLFADWAQSYQARPNELPAADQALCQSVGGDPNIVYHHGYWRLAPDEALLIELPRIPDCEFWNLQIDNYWMESLDYRYHHIHINDHTAVRNPGGGVTAILAHRDPGSPNWLATAGHACGTFCLRWIGVREPVEPVTRVVSLTELHNGA